jgi:arginine-tRNA-protein transferase
MNAAEFNFINESFESDAISADQLDLLLSEGWRHFGRHFFRYNVGMDKTGLQFVLPLRIRLPKFEYSKSQRRIISKNRDLQTVRRPVNLTPETHKLFEKHSIRFDYGKPESIYSFLDQEAGIVPCRTLEFCVYDKKKLVAVSYLDIGQTSVSSVYAIFDPEYNKRSLGIFTMLLEIEYAQSRDKEHYYQGYAYEGTSFYDYKKRFSATEVFDWKGEWQESGND